MIPKKTDKVVEELRIIRLQLRMIFRNIVILTH
jgi:hypothetical protein